MATPAAALPLVSIVVLVYNAEQHLRECLDSLLAQTYPHREILVMDDASTDGTPAILAEYADRLTVYRQPRNRGIYGNANDGVARARGELVAIYHGDDVYEPTIVEREAAYLVEHPEAGAVFCQDVFIDDEGREFGRLHLPPAVRGERPLPYEVVLNAILTHRNSFLPCPSSMVRAAVYAAVGPYAEDNAITGDLTMWLRIARRYPIGILEAYLFRYRRSVESTAERHRRLRTEPDPSFAAIERVLDDGGRELASPAAMAAHEAHRAADLVLLAVNLYILGRREQARSALGAVRPGVLLGSGVVQRARLLVLYLALRALTRVPTIPLVARAFLRRWHGAPGSRKRRVGLRKPVAAAVGLRTPW